MKLLKFTFKQLVSEDFQRILLVFLLWRLFLFVIFVIAINFISLSSNNFLGGGLQNYKNFPEIFAWANFDGEHYLDIILNGYRSLNHSFFPLYPLLVSILTLFNKNPLILVTVGIIISNLAFMISLYVFNKLINLDFKKNVAYLALYLICFFPTSFYFSSFYTESIFLLLTISSVYFARTNRWIFAGILAGLASATRITGILLLPVLLLEWFQTKPRKFPWALLVAPVGLFLYMSYLYITTGDPLTFYRELSVFGVQRQGNFVVLPQVFYRYFNILLTVSPNSLIYWSAVLEFISAILIILTLIYGFLKKFRYSYLLYILLSFLLPSFTGSFSSLPRYFVVIFPLFIIWAYLLMRLSIVVKLTIFIVMIILLGIEAALFLRGYWVA